MHLYVHNTFSPGNPLDPGPGGLGSPLGPLGPSVPGFPLRPGCPQGPGKPLCPLQPERVRYRNKESKVCLHRVEAQVSQY